MSSAPLSTPQGLGPESSSLNARHGLSPCPFVVGAADIGRQGSPALFAGLTHERREAAPGLVSRPRTIRKVPPSER